MNKIGYKFALSVQDKIKEKINFPDNQEECWGWSIQDKSGINRFQFRHEGKKYSLSPSRIIFVMYAKLDLKKEEILVRRCKDPSCVNPAHVIRARAGEKVCNKCYESKKLENFNKKGSYFSYICRSCSKENHKNYYYHNGEYREKQKESARISRNKYQALNQAFVVEYLRNNPCIDCGEDNIIVLEFDHVKDNKKHNISEMVSRAMDLKAIKEEIEKCEVVCANCHRRRTSSRGSWFRENFE